MRLYSSKVDKEIIRIVYEENKITSGKLKETVQEKLGRPISSALFSSRLMQMVSSLQAGSRYAVNPVLLKEDHGRGKKIFYSLTDKAKIRMNLKLQILEEDTAKEKAYQLFLMLTSVWDLPFHSETFSTEEAFDNFLTKLHISRKDLKKIQVREEIQPRKVQISKAEATIIEVPVEVTLLSTVPEEPLSDILIYRNTFPKKESDVWYDYRLPGISIKEALNYAQSNIPFSHIKLTEDEVKECLHLLEKEGFIRRITSRTLEYLNEIRYDIANEPLRGFIRSSMPLMGLSISRMELTWKNLRPPSKEEEEWYMLLWGKERAKVFLESHRLSRHELKQQIMQKKIRDQLNEDIKFYENGMQGNLKKLQENHSGVLSTFFADMLMEWIYPSFLRELQKNHKI